MMMLTKPLFFVLAFLAGTAAAQELEALLRGSNINIGTITYLAADDDESGARPVFDAVAPEGVSFVVG